MSDVQRGDRIAKWLARAGVASRRDVERMLTEGRVKLNNAVVTHPATFVDSKDIIQVDGAVVGEPERTRVWRYHKPDGLVTTHRDPEGRPHGLRQAEDAVAARDQRRPARPDQRGAVAADQ